MRLTILVLLFSSGTAAFCQMAAPAAANPPQLFLIPLGNAQPGREFNKLPPNLTITSVQPLTILIPFDAGLPRLGSQVQIDPQIVVHPATSNVGVQPLGTQVAQNLYPGLLLLPIDELKLKAEPIPAAWPKLKVEQIPIVWPKCAIKPVESGVAGQTAGR